MDLKNTQIVNGIRKQNLVDLFSPEKTDMTDSYALDLHRAISDYRSTNLKKHADKGELALATITGVELIVAFLTHTSLVDLMNFDGNFVIALYNYLFVFITLIYSGYKLSDINTEDVVTASEEFYGEYYNRIAFPRDMIIMQGNFLRKISRFLSPDCEIEELSRLTLDSYLSGDHTVIDLTNRIIDALESIKFAPEDTPYNLSVEKRITYLTNIIDYITQQYDGLTLESDLEDIIKFLKDELNKLKALASEG